MIMVFKNEFSWSKSRDSLFKECKRKYFFNHYGFWNGWITSEDERVKKIYYLKKLASKDIWVGSRVHEMIEFILKRFRVGEDIGLGYSLKKLRNRMESDWSMSKLGGYTGFATKAHRFFEDEYGEGIGEEEKEGCIEKAEICLTNFYNSDIFMEIRQTSVEDWITLEDFLSFDFEGIRVYLSIDFAMRINDRIVLFDWKTGKERRADYELQLGLYALYVSEKLDVPAERIMAKMFYLALGAEGKVDSFEVDSERLEEVKQILRSSISEMKRLLQDVTENEAVEEDFERSEGPWCSRCSFRKVCLGSWDS